MFSTLYSKTTTEKPTLNDLNSFCLISSVYSILGFSPEGKQQVLWVFS